MKLKSALKSGPAAKDPRFQKAIDRLDESAKKARTHEPAAAKANQAQAAAQPPANEKLAGAQANKVESMQEAKTGKPEPASFLEMLRGAIRKAMPTKTEDTEDFMEGDDRQKLKESLAGSANQQTEASAGDLTAASNQTPDTAAVPGKEVVPLPTGPAPASPPAVGAAGAMPEAKPDEEVSLAQGTADVNKKFSDEKITVPQLLKANDPRFTAAAQQKQSVEAYANTAPGQYRAAEKGVLNQAVAAAKGDEQKGLAAFKGQGGKAAIGVKERQLTAKEKDQKARKDVADRIQKMFDDTKARVDAKLAKLDEEVPRIFDAGTELAVMKMKSYVEKRFDERYSGLDGAARWLTDKIGMLPPWVKAWFDQAQQLFLIEMDTLVVRVANLVEFRLKEAKDEIARGQKQIRDYVESLPGNLRAVGLDAERQLQESFTQLREGVDSKKDELAESLAQRYKAAADKGGAALQEMKDAHKGLIDKVADTLAEIAEAMRKFREKVGAMLKKAEKTINLIAADPIGFLGNLLDALKKGVGQFSDNIWTHLKNGFFAWLFGSLADAGIEAPPDFSPGSILKLVLQVLGLTYAKIRGKAVKIIGERNVAIIEKAAEILKALITGGPEKLWEMMKEYLSNLKETIADSVQDFIVTAIIKAAVTKLVSMFNPVGAIIQAILAIYNVVMFFVERINQILAFVQSIIDSVYAIVMHQLDNAANAIEQALARTIPLIISFLARLLGLSGITQKIVGIIKKIQDKVDKAVDKVIAKVVAGIGKLFGGKSKSGDPEKDAKVTAGLAAIDQEDKRCMKEGKITREDAESVAAKVKKEHPVFKSLIVIDGKGRWDFKYAASPEETKEGLPQAGLDADKIESDPPQYEPINDPLGGTGMTAEFLTNKHPQGSTVSVKPPIMDKIPKKRDGTRLYVQGHLLNRLLGGPGNTIKNLTPLTYTANGDHERDAESEVKRLVIDQKMAVKYVVKVHYPSNSAKEAPNPEEGRLATKVTCTWHTWRITKLDPLTKEKGPIEGNATIANVPPWPHDGT